MAMLRTTASADQSLTKHEAAIVHTLAWADAAAANRDYAAALGWLDVIKAIGETLPEEHQRKQATWAAAQGRVA
jgi:hypothetical protein